MQFIANKRFVKKTATLSLSIALALGAFGSAAAAQPIAEILERVRAETPAGANGAAAEIPMALQQLATNDTLSQPRDRVLNQMHAGVVALELGEHRYAAPLFMAAHEQIETIYADDPVAKKARSKFVPDATKEFKGDAYERAMLGYYLGLSYMLNGDLENARASFRWGDFQDTMSASESYQSDMASLMYLRAWAAKCQGETTTAAEEFQSALRIRDTVQLPKDEDNVLMIAEIGSSPIKVGTGKFKEMLSFERGQASAATDITFTYANQKHSLSVAEDVYWQASTLGGRAVDKILAGKASFKQGAETTANVAAGVTQAGLLTATSALAGGNLDLANSMGGIAAAGLVINIGAKMFANRAKPAADIRYWNNLPDQVLFGSYKFDKANSGVVTYRDASGTELRTQPFKVQPTGSCYVAWVRESAEAPAAVSAAVASK